MWSPSHSKVHTAPGLPVWGEEGKGVSGKNGSGMSGKGEGLNKLE